MLELPLFVPEIFEFPANHDFCSNLCNRESGCLGDERHGPACPRVCFKDIDRLVLDCKLEVHEPDNAESQSDFAGIFPDRPG